MSRAAANRLAKRLFDILGATLALAVLSPLLLVVALRIKLDSPGPVFFRQQRVGRHGVLFRIHKFRTMAHGAPGLEITVGADPRITRVGACCAARASTSCRSSSTCCKAR